MSTILVVDDMAVFREPIAAALRTKGHQTFCAGDGLKALAVIGANRPDLILLDMAMPVMDGLSFLQRLRDNVDTRDIPVIMLTAVTDRPKVISAVKLCISDYLLKSRFSLEQLFAKVDQHLPGESREAAKPDADTTSPPPEATADAPSVPAAPTTPSGDQPTQDRPTNIKPNAQVDPIEALKSLKPIMTRSQVKECVDNLQELHAFSPTIALLLKITNDPHCTIDQVVNLVSRDHAVALKMLKLANSAAFCRGQIVDSVRSAVLRIGLSKLRQTVLNIGVIQHFHSSKYGPHIDQSLFWEHAIACAIMAAEIAGVQDHLSPDSAFTMGLLHDTGRLVLSEQLGEQYTQVIQTARTCNLPLELVESRMILLNHADVMDRILHTWNFPRQLTNPIVFHHLSAANIRRHAPRELHAVATIGLANRLVHALLLGTSGNDVIYPTEDLCQLLKLDAKVVENLETLVPEKATDIKLTLLERASERHWPQVREQLLADREVGLRVLFVSAYPQYDAFRIFCDQLRVPGDDEPPNVAVVHLTRPRHRAELGSKLQAAEAEADVANLPLIVLSPRGRLLLDAGAMKNRQYRLMRYPLPPSHFIDTVDTLLAA